jgi:site-specific recombinase XerD
MPPNHKTLSEPLMSNLKQWDTDPVSAFSAFVHGPDFARTSHRLGLAAPKSLSAKSAEIYGFMFRKFAAWLAQENKRFSHLIDQDLVRFISQIRNRGEQNSLITERYLRLLERCYKHLDIRPNPASAALKIATENQYIAKDKGMQVLGPEQVTAFVDALPPFEPGGPNRAGRPPKAWKRRRDHAMLAVMLFSGLRVAEAIGLRLSEVDDAFDGELDEDAIVLRITPEGKHDTSHEHETILRAYGAHALRRWLGERAQLGIQGELVFPTSLAGDPLSRMTVYRQVKATFERAGIDVDRHGGRTLRNTFAVEELRDGGTKTDLKKYLGLALERSAELYELAEAKGKPSA